MNKLESENNITVFLAKSGGFFIWFPMLSVLNIGTRAGIQISFIIFTLILLNELLIQKSNITKSTYLLIILLYFWILGIIITSYLSEDIILTLPGTFKYFTGFTVLLAASFISKNKKARTEFIRFFVIGGIVSSIYATYQIIAFKFRLPLATLFQNNVSFLTWAHGQGKFERPRGFAFTPEPSVFASMLIPVILLLILYILDKDKFDKKENQKNKLILIILLVGSIASTSLSSYTILPASIVILMLLEKTFKKKRKMLITLSISFILVFILLINTIPILNEVYKSALSDRISNTGYDYSYIARSESINSAIRLFFENPFTGQGIGQINEGLDRYWESDIVKADQREAVDSWSLMIATEQGLLGLIPYVILVIMALRNSYKKHSEIFVIIVPLLITTNIQTGYVFLYHVWAFIGLGVGLVYENHKRINTDNFKR